MFISLDGFRNSANVQVVDGDATKEVRAFGKVDLQAADACVSRGKLIQGDFGAVLSKAQGLRTTKNKGWVEKGYLLQVNVVEVDLVDGVVGRQIRTQGHRQLAGQADEPSLEGDFEAGWRHCRPKVEQYGLGEALESDVSINETDPSQE